MFCTPDVPHTMCPRARAATYARVELELIVELVQVRVGQPGMLFPGRSPYESVL